MGLDSPVDDNHDQLAARSAALPSIFSSFSAHRFNNSNNNSNSSYGGIALMNSSAADPSYGSSTANLMPSRGEDFSQHHHHHHQLGSYGNSSAAHHHHSQQQQQTHHHPQQHHFQQLHSRLGVSEEGAVVRGSVGSTALGDFRIHSSPVSMSKTEEAAGGLQRSASLQQAAHFEGNSLSAITAMAPRRADQAAMADEVHWQEQSNQEQSNTNNNTNLTQTTAEAANTDNSANLNIVGANQNSLDQQLQDHQQQIINLQRQQQQQQQRSPSSSSASAAACQDCGNKAKKDCPHMRCRTCCKSRGFNCATHVKSTWVPVSKRRERAQQMQSSELLMAAAGGTAGAGQLSQYVFRPPRFKRTRTLPFVGMGGDSADQSALHGLNIGGAGAANSTSTGTPPRSSSDINSAGDAAKFQVLPPEFKMQAVFRCVKLTGLADGQDEYAYQTAVRIGGHIFKGVLYDQSLDKQPTFTPSSIAELQLGGRAMHSGSSLMDLGIYGAGGSAIIGAFR